MTMPSDLPNLQLLEQMERRITAVENYLFPPTGPTGPSLPQLLDDIRSGLESLQEDLRASELKSSKHDEQIKEVIRILGQVQALLGPGAVQRKATAGG